MVDKDMVSVIVPVYNDAKYIDRCVSSIRKQTYKNLDIILVDDGSKDESGSLCDGYARKDSRIHVIHKENGGPNSACIKGVDAAKGEYLFFVDGDDWIEKDMIMRMVTELSDDEKYADSQIICGSCVIDRVNNEGEKQYHGLKPGVYEGVDQIGKIRTEILGNEMRTISMSRCMKLISVKLIKENLVYSDNDIRMGDDVTMILPALIDAERIVIMGDEFGYHYVYHNDSIVHRYDSDMLTDIHKLDKDIRHIFDEKKIENGISQAGKEYLYLMILVMKNELKNPGKDYRENIQNICDNEEFSKRFGENPIEVHDTANWMIANMMMHPRRWVIQAARIAMKRKLKQNLKT